MKVHDPLPSETLTFVVQATFFNAATSLWALRAVKRVVRVAALVTVGKVTAMSVTTAHTNIGNRRELDRTIVCLLRLRRQIVQFEGAQPRRLAGEVAPAQVPDLLP